MRPFSIIVACDQNNGIGFGQKLPWHLTADLKYFRKITTSVSASGKVNAVIMGRITWQSLPQEFRPLPGRINLILSRNPSLPRSNGVLLAGSLDEALRTFSASPYDKEVENVYVIGGRQIFVEAVAHPLCQKIYLTKILRMFECDVFFPPIPPAFRESHRSETFSENDLQFYFTEYRRP